MGRTESDWKKPKPFIFSQSIFYSIYQGLKLDSDEITPEILREMTCDFAINHLIDMRPGFAPTEDIVSQTGRYLALREYGIWFESLAPTVPRILAKIFNRKIIVVRENERPWYFPYNDNRPITDDTIVIKQTVYSNRPEGEIVWYYPTEPFEYGKSI